jgi:lipopolysaccharide/colanic/teichoic acid biosynthesis glycosyltransferase
MERLSEVQEEGRGYTRQQFFMERRRLLSTRTRRPYGKDIQVMIKELLFHILTAILLVISAPVLLPLVLLVWILWTFYNPEGKKDE